MNILDYSREINRTAEEKGFWEEPVNIAEKLMLIVSEISEAMEADRKNCFCKLTTYEIMDVFDYNTERKQWVESFESHVKNTFEDELADAVIRIFDLAFKKGVNLEKHIKMKMNYNYQRPHKHGKKY